MSTVATYPVTVKKRDSISLIPESGDVNSVDENNSQRTSQAIEHQALSILEGHQHFLGHNNNVKFLCIDNQLMLFGCVQSYYMKQLAQEAVRPITAAAHVELINEIEVVS